MWVWRRTGARACAHSHLPTKPSVLSPVPGYLMMMLLRPSSNMMCFTSSGPPFSFVNGSSRASTCCAASSSRGSRKLTARPPADTNSAVAHSSLRTISTIC